MGHPKLLLLSLLLVLAIVAGGVVWVSSGISDLTSSMFGPASTPSKSMDPYEIVLRTTFKGGDRLPVEARPYEWRLVVPRAFMNVEIGPNGGLYQGNRPEKGGWLGSDTARKGDSFFVFLHTIIDLTTHEISPAIFADPGSLKSNFMAIELSNDGLFPSVIADDYCIRDDDYDSSQIKAGYPVGWKRCEPSVPRCAINTALDGWDVTLIVSRAIYDRPQEICAAARRFLSDHTVQRDNVR